MAINAKGPGGEPSTVTIPSVLADPRYQPTLLENLMLGVSKAHRGIVYSHHDYRNFIRGAQLNRGRISEPVELDPVIRR